MWDQIAELHSSATPTQFRKHVTPFSELQHGGRHYLEFSLEIHISRLICLCLFVTVTHRYCIETAARIRVGFLAYRFPGLMLHCIFGKLGYLQNKGTSLWNFIPNTGLRENIATARPPSTSEINTQQRRSNDDNDVASAINRRPTIVDSWSHSASSSAYSAVVHGRGPDTSRNKATPPDWFKIKSKFCWLI